ncbi:MAG: hypothetical protein ACK5B9_07170 [Flavobacteriia bacterium]|jgi:hypothetical protein
MERRKLTQWVAFLSFGIIIFSQGLCFSKNNLRSMTSSEKVGKNYFEGSLSFKNGGPACISCHSVNNENVMSGGLLAKDLTDVYSRMNEGISAWLMAPSFPAMATSYKNNPLTEKERIQLTAFFKYTNEVKSSQKTTKGYELMLSAGVGGLVVILILVSLIWFKRKKKMVKEDIFKRQTKAWDAKH